MPPTTVEQRLLALEREVAEIKSRLGTSASPAAVDWVSTISGSMKDEPAFDEVVRLGREIRQGDPPPDETGNQPS